MLRKLFSGLAVFSILAALGLHAWSWSLWQTIQQQAEDKMDLDEAQQLTPQEAKTVVTRMSRASKLVMVGDPAQIDNPYVDSRSNGLVYTRNRLKGQAFVAHVSLCKGERSPLAEAGAHLM